jgi:hypothetical protein
MPVLFVVPVTVRKNVGVMTNVTARFFGLLSAVLESTGTMAV